MRIDMHYLLQSGWLIEVDHYLLLIDYWKGQLPATLFNTAKPLIVLASHAHRDHFSPAVFTLAEQRDNVTYLLSDDIADYPDGIRIHNMSEGDCIELQGLSVKAYGSTDEGVSFLIRMPDVCLFHAGDYNLWHWPAESTEEEIAEAEHHFYRILGDMERDKALPRVVFFPVDSRQKGDYDRGAREFAERIRPEVFLPMHYFSDWHSPEPFCRWAAQEMPEMKVLAVTPEKKSFTVDL